MQPMATMQLVQANLSSVSATQSCAPTRGPSSSQDIRQSCGKFLLKSSGAGLGSASRFRHRLGVTRRRAAGERFVKRFAFSRKTVTRNLTSQGEEFQGQGQGQAFEESSFAGDGQARNPAPGASEEQYLSTVSVPQIIPRSLRVAQLSVVDQAVLVVGVIACTASFSLLAFVITVIPTLHAMRKAANSVEKLADTAREELPGTMAAIRLSGMEISDLTLELNDLSQEISDGVKNSARAVHAAEAGLRQLGALAASQTFAMLQGTASVPVQVVRPAVASAAATTLHAMSQAQKLVSNLASSSYPHISGWLTQRKLSGKQRKSVAKILSSATYSELLTREGSSGSSPLSDKSDFALSDSADKRQ